MYRVYKLMNSQIIVLQGVASCLVQFTEVDGIRKRRRRRSSFPRESEPVGASAALPPNSPLSVPVSNPRDDPLRQRKSIRCSSHCWAESCGVAGILSANRRRTSDRRRAAATTKKFSHFWRVLPLCKWTEKMLRTRVSPDWLIKIDGWDNVS